MGHKKLINDIQSEGLTIKAMAELLNVSAMSIYRWKKSETISGRRQKNLTDLLEGLKGKRSVAGVAYAIKTNKLFITVGRKADNNKGGCIVAYIKNGYISICSEVFDYGMVEYSLKSRSAVETLQKELIENYPTDKVGDMESDSFEEAFDYTDKIHTVEIDMASSPDDLKKYAKKLIDLADKWAKDKDLILYYH